MTDSGTDSQEVVGSLTTDWEETPLLPARVASSGSSSVLVFYVYNSRNGFLSQDDARTGREVLRHWVSGVYDFVMVVGDIPLSSGAYPRYAQTAATHWLIKGGVKSSEVVSTQQKLPDTRQEGMQAVERLASDLSALGVKTFKVALCGHRSDVEQLRLGFRRRAQCTAHYVEHLERGIWFRFMSVLR